MASCPPILDPNAPPDPPATVSFLGGKFKVYFTEFQQTKEIDPETGHAWVRLYRSVDPNDVLTKEVFRLLAIKWASEFKAATASLMSNADVLKYSKFLENRASHTLGELPVSEFVKAIKAKTNVEWRNQFGLLKAPFAPKTGVSYNPPSGASITNLPTSFKADERAKDYAARGGYYIPVNLANGMSRLSYIEEVNPSWLPKDDPNIEDFDLGIRYAPNYQKSKYGKYGAIQFAVRGEKPGWMDRIGDFLRSIVKKLCNALTNDTIGQAAAFAAAYPSAQAYSAAWSTTSTLCNFLFPKCTPPVVYEPPPVETPPWWERKEVLYVAGGAAVLVTLGVVAKAVRSKE